MSQLIIIGTLHGGITDLKELEQIIIDINPTTVLVEICAEHLYTEKMAEYPEEMIFVAKWCREHTIKCFGFDSLIDVSKTGVTKEDEQAVVDAQDAIIKQYTWKDFNKPELLHLLIDLALKIRDQRIWNQRETEMRDSIFALTPSLGTTLVITGCGHIPYFQSQFKEARFPLS